MKKIFVFLIIFSLCFNTGCFSFFKKDDNASSQIIMGVDSSSPANAYYQVFAKLITSGEIAFEMNSIKYLALDLDGVSFQEKNLIQTMFTNYCTQNNWTLIVDDVSALVQRSKQGGIFFPDGLILSFSDESFSEKSITGNVFLWHPNGEAIDSKFTANKSNGTWVVTSL